MFLITSAQNTKLLLLRYLYLNDDYLGTYVQWEGEIAGYPESASNLTIFQVMYFNFDIWGDNTSADDTCDFATFFVGVNDTQKFYPQDTVRVTGVIISTNYEYAGGRGQRMYAPVIAADKVEVLNKPTP